MTESTIINGDLSCDNCPDKIRCKEQQEKKNNIIKNILNDIVDKANIYGCDIKEETEILFQQISNVTRCDVVLEKQLKRKEQECLTLINKNNRLEEKYNTLEMLLDGKNTQYNQLKQECRKYKKYKKCIKSIRDELEYSLHCEAEECGCDDDSECLKCTINLILKKINEVENER